MQNLRRWVAQAICPHREIEMAERWHQHPNGVTDHWREVTCLLCGKDIAPSKVRA